MLNAHSISACILSEALGAFFSSSLLVFGSDAYVLKFSDVQGCGEI